jgi:DNA-binding response OmpR family regulator
MTPPARARILIVDDDPDVREVIELTLAGQGYEVTSVGGGQAALAQLAHEAFGLIVCDLGMPTVDGVALYEALQGRPAPHPAVLFLSGFHDDARYEAFLQETGAPRLVKPFDVTVLRATVRGLLGRARELVVAYRAGWGIGDPGSGGRPLSPFGMSPWPDSFAWPVADGPDA